jgi:hypothetical protein
MLGLMAAGLVMVIGAVAMSVDVGYLYVARNQLQNAADAAALAGAQGLLIQPGNYTANGQAMLLAKQFASLNQADGKPIILNSNEITFPRGNVIKVDLTRSVNTFFGRVIGVNQANLRVMAAASVVPAVGGNREWRPFAAPDQFSHGGACVTPFDDSHGPFNPTPHEWGSPPVTASDTYQSPYDSVFSNQDLSAYTSCGAGSPTGFIAPRDVDGRLVELKSSHPNYPGNFYPIALGGTGADAYRYNIDRGWTGTINVGDILTTETGAMTGPTRQGVDALVAQDPNAQLLQDGNGKRYVSSDRYPMNESPRIVPIPMFDPTDPPGGGRNTFRVANIASFFIQSSNGNSVFGYFIPRRLAGAVAGRSVSYTSNHTSGANGYLLGTAQFVDPTKY